MRRPPRPVQIPKVRVPVHERKAALRMVLVAAAIAALILSGNLQRAQAEGAVVASTAVPVQLQGWSAPGSQSCGESWAAVQIPVNDCLYDWWLLEPQRSELGLDWQTGAMGGSTLGLSDLPPPTVQRCLQRAMMQASPDQVCEIQETLSLPPS
ncbi:MAG: hypothetical protein ACI9VR_003440 [Cognaticolwellia sp.]|jgi:hypothetical protein